MKSRKACLRWFKNSKDHYKQLSFCMTRTNFGVHETPSLLGVARNKFFQTLRICKSILPKCIVAPHFLVN